MSNKKRPKNRDPHRTATRRPAGGPPKRAPLSETEELPPDEFVHGIDNALRDPNPLALLNLASGIIATRDPRQQLPGAPAPSGPTLAELCQSFMNAGLRQTDALLKVIAVMAPDDLLRERIRRSVAERRHAAPGWVLRLDQVRPYRAVEMLNVLRDGDDIVIGVHLPGNRRLSALAYIDHNMGTVVKDAFILDQPLDDVIDAWHEINAQSGAEAADTTVTELSLADARARITAAVDAGASTFPPFESESWPMCRPLIEWIVSMLPEGGTDYERPEWSEDQLAGLTEAFFGSAFGRPLDDDDHRSLLESILWFGTGYGPGDPLRWSPVAVEILLADWIPRKLVAPADFLAKVPEVLRGFIRFCHTERGIRAELTAETLAAVDQWEPDYQNAIRAHGVEPAWYTGVNPATAMLGLMAETVGGAGALDRLGTEPLPDEPFDWSGIPEDIVARVDAVRELVDGCCDALFDVEYRTASRRFLARVAAADPSIFRGRSLARTIAATVCWVVRGANDAFPLEGGTVVLVKEIMAYFGVSGSMPTRAEPMLKALGLDWSLGSLALNDAALLVSAERAEIVLLRDAYRAAEVD